MQANNIVGLVGKGQSGKWLPSIDSADQKWRNDYVRVSATVNATRTMELPADERRGLQFKMAQRTRQVSLIWFGGNQPGHDKYIRSAGRGLIEKQIFGR